MKVDILLKPKHFKDTTYFSRKDCPLARAVKQHFRVKHVCVGGTVGFKACRVVFGNRTYEFNPKLWNERCYDEVRRAYEKDPRVKEWQYYVTLTKVS